MFIAAVRTVLGLVITALYILIVAPPFLLWTAITRNTYLLYIAGETGVRLSLALVGIKVRVEGREHLQFNRSAVYMANHISHADSASVFHALSPPLRPRLRILYKAELRKIPILVWVWDFAGFVPIERANRAQSLPAVGRASEALREGNSFFIFPEGTRSVTGKLLPFKKGGFLMAIAAQAPVVPMTVAGGANALRKGSWVVHPATVTIRLGPPIETAGMTQSDRETLVRQVRGAIEGMLTAAS
jgi:1-acyl-sn-glycerol-3-phosphate acyltransferase